MTHIDQSLNLLKDLQVKLKYRKQPKRDHRIRTDYDQPYKQSQLWGERLATAYQSAEGELKSENKRLKRHVNRLIRMNDYLKNRLVKQDHYDHKYSKFGNQNREIEMLKIQIDYLRELNKQKQLKIQLINHNHNKKKKGLGSSITRSERDRQLSKSTKNMTHCQHDTLRSSMSVKKKHSYGNTLRKSTQSVSKGKCPLCY